MPPAASRLAREQQQRDPAHAAKVSGACGVRNWMGAKVSLCARLAVRGACPRVQQHWVALCSCGRRS